MKDEGKIGEGSVSNEGEYTQEDLEEMLENFVKAKQIEADPAKLAMLKEFAQSKSKAITELFDVNKVEPVKSLKDIKKIYNEKLQKERDEE